MASWERRGENTYRLIAYQGYNAAGKKMTPKRKTIKIAEKMSEGRLKKHLDKLAMLFEEEVNSGQHPDGSKMTFEQLSQLWLKDYAEKQLEQKTLTEYQYYLKRIIPAFGHIKINKLQPHHITQFYSNLLEGGVRLDKKYILNQPYINELRIQSKSISESTGIGINTIRNLLHGGRTIHRIAETVSNIMDIQINKMFTMLDSDKGLSTESVLHYHRMITAILNKAVKWQLIQSNPATKAEKPKAKHTEVKFYDEEESMRMLGLLYNEPLKYQAAIYIALYGGLRIGEVTGLEWDNVNFEENIIYIVRARQYIPEYGSFDKSTKTAQSRRVVTLPTGVMDVIKDYKREQEEIKCKLANKWQDTGKMFTQWNGEPMFPSTPSKWFNKWLKRVDLPVITFHQLRHSHASILIANGVDIATVSKRLGHAKITTTINTYTHAIKNRDTIAADIIGSRLPIGGQNCPIEPK